MLRAIVFAVIVACMGTACAQDSRANNPTKDEVSRRDKLFFTLGLGFMDLRMNGPVISDGDELTGQLRSLLVELEAPRTLIARLDDLQEVYKVPKASRQNMEKLAIKDLNHEWQAYFEHEGAEAAAYAFMGISASLLINHFTAQSLKLSNGENAEDEDETEVIPNCQSADPSNCVARKPKGPKASDQLASVLATLDESCVPEVHCSPAMIDDFHQLAALSKADNKLVEKTMPIMRDLYDRALVAY
jgi:hypothetical protein